MGQGAFSKHIGAGLIAGLLVIQLRIEALLPPAFDHLIQIFGYGHDVPCLRTHLAGRSGHHREGLFATIDLLAEDFHLGQHFRRFIVLVVLLQGGQVLAREQRADGHFYITDRKKDLIKTAGGKYVAPQKIEGLLKQEPLISQVLVIGDQKKYVSALISCEGNQEQKEDILNKIHSQIQKVNSVLASYESVKRYEVVFEAWTVDNGSLTPSMKVKRKVLEKKYFEIIEKIYLELSKKLKSHYLVKNCCHIK